MIVTDLIFSLLVAVLLGSLLVWGLGWRHPRHGGAGVGLLFLLIVLFAATWVGGTWTGPYGPALWGAYFVPFLVMGLLFAFLLMTVATAPVDLPPRDLERNPEASQPPEMLTEEQAVAGGIAAVFGIFFWFFILIAVVAVLVQYLT